MKSLTPCALVAFSIFATTAQAAAPSDVADLVDARAAGGESALESRGYVHINTEKGADRAWSNWWNPSSRVCLNVVTMDGRYNSIDTVPAFDCNQKSANETSEAERADRNEKIAGAALAVGAAAVIGALALSHKSHHHDDEKHHDDADHESEFDRGFRDGLHNKSYHDKHNNDAYREGYNAGVEKRDHETSHRHHSGDHDRGYQTQVAFADLKGARAAGATSELKNRGFKNVDGFKSNNAAYTIWYNRRSGQCLQLIVADGRAENITDIHTHAACR